MDSTQLADDFRHFMNSLTQAGLKLDSHYFRIDVAGSDEAVFRERVYCYELYHQLRNTLGDHFHYKLDGEIDKVSHRLIAPVLGAKKPDFVVHVPGEMTGNLAIVEVKSLAGAQADNMGGLVKDLDTLRGFIKDARYYRAVMLVYGDGKHELPSNIATKVGEARTREDRILLVWHSGPGEPPEVILR